MTKASKNTTKTAAKKGIAGDQTTDKKGTKEKSPIGDNGKGTEIDDSKESVKCETPKKKQSPKAKHGRSSGDRKKFKITTRVGQPNKRAWQIRGFKIQQGMLGFFFQKSIGSGLEEEPFLKEFLSKLERSEELRETDLGIAFTGVRADEDGSIIPGNSKIPGSEWSLFIAFEKDAGSIQDWLDVVCKRMNDDDIAANHSYFKWNVSFTVTSWGDADKVPKLCDVMTSESAAELVAGLFNIDKEDAEDGISKEIDLSKYFKDHESGEEAIKEHVNRFNV